MVLSSAVLQYRQAYTGNNPAQVQTAMDGFEDVIRRFPKCAEGYALYAQVCSFSLFHVGALWTKLHHVKMYPQLH